MNDLPPFDPRDGARCREIIAGLPLTDVPLAHELLFRLLTAIDDTPPSAAEHLALLEAASEPLAELQPVLAARYAAKPLPASPAETEAFTRTLAFWQLMARSYARVARRGATDADVQDRLPLVHQRCIHYAGEAVIEHFRARRPVAPGLWIDLHERYAAAEALGVIDEPVIAANDGVRPSGRETYAAVLLAALANPYGRTARELSWLLRWSRFLAPLTTVRVPEAEAGGRGYGVDLAVDRGPLPADLLSSAATARLFDTSRLGAEIQRLLARLKAGERPADLGLGEDCAAVPAGRLLVQLYRPWCLAAMPRRFERHRAGGMLAVAYAPEAIYFHVCGKEFVQPQHTRTYSRTDVERLWMQRNQLDPTMPLKLRTAALEHAHDLWEIRDESLNGFRLARNAAGPRIEHGQLVALRPPGRDHFVLARITWLAQEADGRLEAGIHVFPGPVSGVALRRTGATVTPADPYVPGYFLPAVAALKERVSVVLPAGWFCPGRIIEIYTDRSVHVRLDELLARGPNFDRCAFTLTDPAPPAAAAAPR